MGTVLQVYSPKAYREYLLPAINNTETVLVIEKACFQLQEDVLLKLEVVEGAGEVISRSYHHGRCDVGSPWARGEAFDVLEEEAD